MTGQISRTIEVYFNHPELFLLALGIAVFVGIAVAALSRLAGGEVRTGGGD